MSRQDNEHAGLDLLAAARQRGVLTPVIFTVGRLDPARGVPAGAFGMTNRIDELGALDMSDVSVSARRGRVKIWTGKGDAYREVPLNSPCRNALDEWVAARAEQLAALADARGGAATAPEPSALWLSRSGTRMTTRAIDCVIRRLAADAGLELSAHILRHYVDGWVMWPAGVFPLLRLAPGPIPAT